MSKKQEVMNWEDQMANEAKAIAKTERPSTSKISFKSGVMTYMGNVIPDNTLDCIIVASSVEHVFYTEKWNAKEVKPPACFALGLPGEEMVAHESVPDSPGPVCSTCEMFKWNSDLEGGKGKACSERRRLAVIPAFKDVSEIKGSEIAVMSIPVMSVKNWANYINKLSATSQRPPWGVLTRVKLVPDARSQFVVTFEALELLSSEALGEVHSRIELATMSVLVPHDLNPPETDGEDAVKESDKY